MKLINSPDGFTIEVEPEIYTIAQFAQLAESRKDKKLLLKELGYIYFFTDMKSDFQFQTNETLRHKDLIKYLDLPKDWKKDKFIEEAIEAYKYLSQNVSSRLLQSVYLTVDKIKAQLELIDLNERDKSGKPVWNIKQIQEVAKGLPDLMMNLDKAEKLYIKSQEDNSKLRGNKQKSMYDNGNLGRTI